jgi:hypothetical protein
MRRPVWLTTLPLPGVTVLMTLGLWLGVGTVEPSQAVDEADVWLPCPIGPIPCHRWPHLPATIQALIETGVYGQCGPPSPGGLPAGLDLFRNNKEVENGVVGNCFHCDEPELLQPANSLDARASTGG